MLAECHEGSYVAFGVMLGYNAVLAFVCFICAFKGRKLPEKYNDAKFITFGMLLYLISWLIFVPVYVTTSGVYVPAVEMVVILISSYGILGCHFFPKCYVILFRQQQNTRSAFKQNVYEYSRRSAESISASETSSSPGETPVHQPYIISAPSFYLPAPEPKVPQASGEVTTDLISCTQCGSNRELASQCWSHRHLESCAKRGRERGTSQRERLRRTISM